MPFETLGVVLEEKAKGGKAKQKGLDEPQAANGRVVDAFVAAGKQEMEPSFQMFC